ncbi:kelch protein 24 [Biomphalaria glabrata]|uniref:BTB domain-containing protein n=1 Tax=Biomphalaria glabrata TaxID=6526 RepID=A0A2C9M3H9_BIOGL|nr:kelch protein 24 [Biomphalaria glabrata]
MSYSQCMFGLEVTETMGDSSYWLQKYYRVLSSKVERIYTSSLHTDMTIAIEEKKYECHRAILCAFSSYFEAMFASGMKESISGIVKIEGTDSSLFESILDYIYKGSNVVNEENAEDMLAAATFLQMECLRTRCEEFISEALTSANCFETWRMAVWHSNQYIQQQAWMYIMSNFVKIAKETEFLLLEKDELVSVIKDDLLNTPDEDFVVQSVLTWLQHDLNDRGQFCEELFSYLKLPLTKWEFLIEMYRKYPFLKEYSECQKYIEDGKHIYRQPAHRHDSSSSAIAYRSSSSHEDILVVIAHRPSIPGSRNVLALGFSSRKWYYLDSLPYDPGVDFATCVYSNDIFLTGGSLCDRGFLQYRAPRNEWMDYRNWSMQTGRIQHTMAVCSKKLYAIGGYFNTPQQGYKLLSSIEEFELGSDGWIEVGALAVPVSSTSATSYNEKILLFGGESCDRIETATIQCFDTKTQTASVIGQLPIASKLTRAIVCDSYSYVVLTNGTIVQLDHRTDAVTIAGQMENFARSQFGLSQRLGSLIIVGGQIITPDSKATKLYFSNMLMYDLFSKKVNIMGETLPPPKVIEGCHKITQEKKFLCVEYVDRGIHYVPFTFESVEMALLTSIVNNRRRLKQSTE